jgi:hypothetical protein
MYSRRDLPFRDARSTRKTRPTKVEAFVDFGLETIRQSVAALGRSKIGYAGLRKVCSWHRAPP